MEALIYSVTNSVNTPTFSWTGPGGFTASTEDISGLIAGAYVVTITDGPCSISYPVTLTQPTALSASAAVTSNYNGFGVSCLGSSNGSIAVTAGGGVAPLQYSLISPLPASPLQLSNTFSSLTAGPKVFTIQDANGCSINAGVTITAPLTGVTITASSNSPVYAGSAANFNSTPVGGTLPYSFSWTPGASMVSSTVEDPTITAASVGDNGSYSVLVTDANGCTSTATTALIVYGTDLYVNDNLTGGDVFTTAVGNNANPGTASAPFRDINYAISIAQAGYTIYVDAGTYDEQVIVNKALTINGPASSKPVVNFTGTVSGRPTLFDVTADNVSINNVSYNVDLSKLRSAILASSIGLDYISVDSCDISAYSTPAGSYGDRNAVSVNYGGSTNYRVATGGVNTVLFTKNTVNGTGSAYFRSGIALDEGGLTATGNTLTTINHDVLLRFASNGANNISNNTFNGGGVELADQNAGSGTITVSGNTFASAGAPNTAVLRLKNNYNGISHVISGNTFTGFEWAASVENMNNVSFSGNTFTATSPTARHIHFNTKSISSNSSGIVQVPVGISLTNNNFNGTGTALTFANHDDDADSYGTITIGSGGNENNFAATLSNFIVLDAQTGVSNTSTFPVYGNSVGWNTYTPGPNDLSSGSVTLTLTANGNAPCPPASSTVTLTYYNAIEYFTDGDFDTYGGVTAGLFCSNPGAGYSLISGDCNDANAAVNPAASEICNGIDDNCNGLVDDNVPALPSLGAISGTTTSCRAGVAGTASFSVAPVAGASTYAWSVPAGFVITSGQGTVLINVSYTALAIQSGITGSLCVVASDACVSTAPSCAAVSYQVSAPVTPGSISGPGKVCPGDVATYSVGLVTRATAYT